MSNIRTAANAGFEVFRSAAAELEGKWREFEHMFVEFYVVKRQVQIFSASTPSRTMLSNFVAVSVRTSRNISK